MNDFILIRPIPRYEGLYLITSDGTIFKVKVNGARQFINSSIRREYYTVKLSKNGCTRTEYVHRLLAEAFIPNVYQKCCVNHKDGNKLNNSLSNLEWATHAENMKHAYDTGLLFPTNRRRLISRSRKRRFMSIKEAAKEYGLNYNTLKNMVSGFNKNITDLEYEEKAAI